MNICSAQEPCVTVCIPHLASNASENEKENRRKMLLDCAKRLVDMVDVPNFQRDSHQVCIHFTISQRDKRQTRWGPPVPPFATICDLKGKTTPGHVTLVALRSHRGNIWFAKVKLDVPHMPIQVHWYEESRESDMTYCLMDRRSHDEIPPSSVLVYLSVEAPAVQFRISEDTLKAILRI